MSFILLYSNPPGRPAGGQFFFRNPSKFVVEWLLNSFSILAHFAPQLLRDILQFSLMDSVVFPRVFSDI